MKLPLLVSVPHAGMQIPPEAEDLCILTEEAILQDSDEGAGDIYDLDADVAELVSTDVARAICDMNRAETDRRKDGIVKTHTCYDIPVYSAPLPETHARSIIDRYWRPYHLRLSAPRGDVWLGVDCHTMAAVGPPVGPDPGRERPWICLSDGDGTCPPAWRNLMLACLSEQFEGRVTHNQPFRGGYITRTHAAERPWMQLEMSRAPFYPNPEKRQRVLAAFSAWCGRLPDSPGRLGA